MVHFVPFSGKQPYEPLPPHLMHTHTNDNELSCWISCGEKTQSWSVRSHNECSEHNGNVPWAFWVLASDLLFSDIAAVEAAATKAENDALLKSYNQSLSVAPDTKRRRVELKETNHQNTPGSLQLVSSWTLQTEMLGSRSLISLNSHARSLKMDEDCNFLCRWHHFHSGFSGDSRIKPHRRRLVDKWRGVKRKFPQTREWTQRERKESIEVACE